MDGSIEYMNMQNDEIEAKTAGIASRNLSQMRSRARKSPLELETEVTKRPGQWRHVSDKGNNIYTLQSAPIESLDMRIQKNDFGRSFEALCMDERLAASVWDTVTLVVIGGREKKERQRRTYLLVLMRWHRYNVTGCGNHREKLELRMAIVVVHPETEGGHYCRC